MSRGKSIAIGLAVVFGMVMGGGAGYIIFADKTQTEYAVKIGVSAPGQVRPGETFTVRIDVDLNTAIAGVQFDMAFDTSVVTASSVTEGDLMKRGGANTYFMPGSIDNTGGTISGVAGVVVGPGQAVSASGTFALIAMIAGTGEGTSPLTLSNVVAGDTNGDSVPVEVVDGQVTIK